VIGPSQRSLPDNTQHSQHTSMPPVGFEPTISAGERPQTYSLEPAATGAGCVKYTVGYATTNSFYQGADNSLAWPGRKQARRHVRDARDFNNIETRAAFKVFFFCKAKRRRKGLISTPVSIKSGCHNEHRCYNECGGILSADV